MKTNYEQKIDTIFNKLTKSSQIHESVLLIESKNGDFSYKKVYGGKTEETLLLLASITKLFTTTCIFALEEKGKLSLDDKIVNYFDQHLINKLHVYKGVDYSAELTISHLMCQTSGLPDVFEEREDSIKKHVIQKDLHISFDETIAMTKQLKPHFPPNSANKAYYADVNFDILGKIIEKVTDSRLEDIYNQFIYEPLGLKNTYLPQEENDFVPDIYYKQTRLQRPLFINSCPASGGGVSTARELMVFMKAFFSGQLFSHIHFKKHSLSNHLQMSMYPIQYGGGYMRIPLEGFSTLFTGKGELVGHTGSTGSFAFYYPHKELFLVGGVNQLANPTIPIRTAIKLAIALK